MKILAHSNENDEVEEDIKVAYDGGDLEIALNARYLIDFFSVMHSEYVRLTFSESGRSALVEELGGKNGLYVIMPMRI